MGPIKTEFIQFPKCNLIKNRLLIAIDSGMSLTKILFLNKDKKEQFLNDEEKFLTLDFILFPNSEFECALEWIKMNAFALEDNDYSLHATGAFVLKNQYMIFVLQSQLTFVFREKIKSTLNKEVIYIDEFLTIAAGHKLALENIGVEKMLSKPVNVESFGKIDNKMINKVH